MCRHQPKFPAELHCLCCPQHPRSLGDQVGEDPARVRRKTHCLFDSSHFSRIFAHLCCFYGGPKLMLETVWCTPRVFGLGLGVVSAGQVTGRAGGQLARLNREVLLLELRLSQQFLLCDVFKPCHVAKHLDWWCPSYMWQKVQRCRYTYYEHNTGKQKDTALIEKRDN